MSAQQALPQAGWTTLAAPTQAERKDRGSRFLAFAHPVATRTQVDQLLKHYQAEYAEARHVCYAWRLGDDQLANDGHEPAHSAGTPILRRLQGAGVSHGLVVVVRYFGGTKLGLPGLVEAYGGAAADALALATVVPHVPSTAYRLCFDYSDTGPVERWLAQNGLNPSEKAYGARCDLVVSLPDDQAQALCAAFGELNLPTATLLPHSAQPLP